MSEFQVHVGDQVEDQAGADVSPDEAAGQPSDEAAAGTVLSGDDAVSEAAVSDDAVSEAAATGDTSTMRYRRRRDGARGREAAGTTEADAAGSETTRKAKPAARGRRRGRR